MQDRGRLHDRAGRQGGARRPARTWTRERTLFWMLVAFFVLVALTGGSSRPDTLSLVVLRPAALLLCAVAAWSIEPAQLHRYRFVFALFAAVAGLAIIHLVPLPPAIWQALPGRDLIATVDALAGLGKIWRPMSLAPAETRNALFSLVVPLAVLLAGAQLGHASRASLVTVMLGLVVASAVLGLLQMVGPAGGPLFLYAHTNYGTPTGLLANRNHQAIFLAAALPMLAAFAAMRADGRHGLRDAVAALGLGLFIIPLLLVIGSRAGVVIAGVGLLSSAWLLRSPGGNGRSGSRSQARSRLLLFAGLAALVAMVALTIGLSRALSVTRMVEMAAGDELRFKVWPSIVAAIPTYFPIGTGVGVFASVFQITEPDAILRPTYLNHAHNEPLEILLTAGLPGLILLVVGLAGWGRGMWWAVATRHGGNASVLTRLGLVVIALLALGSFGDYPLRAPFLAALLALAGLWAGDADRLSAR